MNVHPSALKHGVGEIDILAAASATVYVTFLDDDSPSRQLRLGFDSGTELVSHAAKARASYLDLLD